MNEIPVATDTFIGTLKAFKVARLVLGDDGHPGFRGIGLGGGYGATDVAVCTANPEHVPPHPGCACGFYAVKKRATAIELIWEDRPALLDVELWGAFHEFELGYIAAAQRVQRVTLQPYCAHCVVGKEARLRAATVLIGPTHEDSGGLEPVCDQHAEGHEVVVLHRLEDALGVPCRWADDDDPLTEHAKRLLCVPARVFPPPRHLDDLLPGKLGYVFHNTIAQDADGQLYIDPLARLIQPLPGTDIPIRLNDDGQHELLLHELTEEPGWQPRTNVFRFALPCVTAEAEAPAEDPNHARREVTERTG